MITAVIFHVHLVGSNGGGRRPWSLNSCCSALRYLFSKCFVRYQISKITHGIRLAYCSYPNMLLKLEWLQFMVVWERIFSLYNLNWSVLKNCLCKDWIFRKPGPTEGEFLVLVMIQLNCKALLMSGKIDVPGASFHFCANCCCALSTSVWSRHDYSWSQRCLWIFQPACHWLMTWIESILLVG